MKNEFIPYEQALALKELGFDEPCLGFYNHQGQLILMTQEDENSIQVYKNSYVKLGKQYAVPLHQQAFRWFREKYDIIHEIVRKEDRNHREFIAWVYVENGKIEVIPYWNALTYEEVELACLMKLIEIVKNK